MSKVRHITAPAGFVAAGIKCGIKVSGKEDLAVVACERDAAVAIMTTRNQVFGEPVRYCRDILPKNFGTARAIVINSGCSNVCTGQAGYKDAVKMASATAAELGTTAQKVLVASTGVIGHRLPMDKILKGIPRAVSQLGTGNDSLALRAIMTTDTREKYAVARTTLGGKTVTVGGMVKGAGMIAPSMATMICVLTTDLAASPAVLHKALKQTIDSSLNAVTIDSDTSTSDTAVLLASGAAGNKPLAAGSADFKKFVKALAEVLAQLARAVAADGEGATKLITINVRGARSAAEAEIAAKSVANSPLFKCAVHGGDPNWGRIASALGKSAAKVDPAKLVIRVGGVTIFARGRGLDFDLKKVQQHLKGKDVHVAADLGLGKGSYTAITCDLSREYITINADYHT
ncbi:MAG: bifunctional glutamate N-acetyltransferase/amino-acid acetyltransferase ArgJ [Phycisphaerae bacterium]|jgi:glutamate N-acetyltransferase/amino-acid N-acetyltransferase